MTRNARVALAAVVLVTGACGGDFVPFNRLVSLRVLAVQSEPVAPLTGETSALTPLVYAPPGVDVESYEWSWCPFPGPSDEGYRCLVTEEDVRDLAAGAADTIPPFDLGSDPTAVFDNSIDPDLLAALCEGAGDVPALADCEGGFPVQLKLTVRTEDEEIVTVRTLRLRFDPDSEANANPMVDELVAELDGDEVVLTSDPDVPLPRSAETTIRARVPAESSETYTDLVDGELVEKRERLVLTWFVESGDTSDERTVFIDGSVSLEDATENEWEPAGEDDYQPDESVLIVVMRDLREGVTWLGGAVALEDDP